MTERAAGLSVPRECVELTSADNPKTTVPDAIPRPMHRRMREPHPMDLASRSLPTPWQHRLALRRQRQGRPNRSRQGPSGAPVPRAFVGQCVPTGPEVAARVRANLGPFRGRGRRRGRLAPLGGVAAHAHDDRRTNPIRIVPTHGDETRIGFLQALDRPVGHSLHRRGGPRLLSESVSAEVQVLAW